MTSRQKCKNRKEYMKEYHKKWYEKNKDKILKQDKEKYEKNSTPKRQYDKKYYQEHNQKLKLMAREYRKRNPEKIKEINKNYYKKNKEEHDKQTLKWIKENRDKVNKWIRRWRKTERGKLITRKNNIKRRALEKGNNLTIEQLKIILDRDKTCIYCKTDNKKLTLEHITPLTKGGENSFSNCAMACINCNSSKRNKDVLIWCKEQKIEVPKIVLNLLKAQEELGLIERGC